MEALCSWNTTACLWPKRNKKSQRVAVVVSCRCWTAGRRLAVDFFGYKLALEGPGLCGNRENNLSWYVAGGADVKVCVWTPPQVLSIACVKRRHFCVIAQPIAHGCADQVRTHLLFCSLPTAGLGAAAPSVDVSCERGAARETFSLSGSESR